MCKVHLLAELCPIDVVVVLSSGRSVLWLSSYDTSYDLYVRLGTLFVVVFWPA